MDKKYTVLFDYELESDFEKERVGKREQNACDVINDDICEQQMDEESTALCSCKIETDFGTGTVEKHQWNKGNADDVENDGNYEQPSTSEEKLKRGPPRTEEEMRECRYCEFQADDWPMFAKHVFKPHHIKKVAEAFNIKLAKAGFNCDICSITCSGQQTFNDHLLGTKHGKALEKKTAEKQKSEGGIRVNRNQSGNIQHKKPYDRVPKRKVSQAKAIGAEVFANYPQPLIGLEYVTEVQVAGQNPRYECLLCDAKFEHDLKFPHLVGQKHRMNVLRIKRPDFVKELHPTSKKRSELTALLLRESIDLELAEGRNEVKTRVEKPPRGSLPLGRGNSRGWAAGFKSHGRGSADYSPKGARGNRGMNRGISYFRGGTKKEPYGSFSGPGGSYSSYDDSSYGNDSFEYDSFRRNSFSYDIPPYSSFDNPTFGRGYQQSSGYGQAYPDRDPSYVGSDYSAPPAPQIELPRTLDIPAQREISSGLASALGDLTKFVRTEGDASVALQVSNALTQALLQYRMDGDLQQKS